MRVLGIYGIRTLLVIYMVRCDTAIRWYIYGGRDRLEIGWCDDVGEGEVCGGVGVGVDG